MVVNNKYNIDDIVYIVNKKNGKCGHWFVPQEKFKIVQIRTKTYARNKTAIIYKLSGSNLKNTLYSEEEVFLDYEEAETACGKLNRLLNLKLKVEKEYGKKKG